MIRIEQVDQRNVVARNEVNFQLQHEATDGQPEIVPYHHNALHMLAITLPQRLNQPCGVFGPPSVQPLFKLIEDDQNLAARWKVSALPQRCQRFPEIRFR